MITEHKVLLPLIATIIKLEKVREKNVSNLIVISGTNFTQAKHFLKYFGRHSGEQNVP